MINFKIKTSNGTEFQKSFKNLTAAQDQTFSLLKNDDDYLEITGVTGNNMIHRTTKENGRFHHRNKGYRFGSYYKSDIPFLSDSLFKA